MRKLTLTGLAIFALSAPVHATELTGSPNELRNYLQSETRTVNIRKSAKEQAESDIAKITLIVSTSGRDLASAIEENNNLRDSIRRTLLDAGVDADDIQSSKYSASPQYGWFGNNPNSYDVVNTLKVSVDTDAEFRMVAKIADDNDDVRFGTAEFEHSEKEAYEAKVRDKAMAEIKEEREYYEAALGLTLTPISFITSDVQSMDRSRFQGIEEIVVTGARDMAMSSAAPKRIAPTTFDTVEYNITITVTFAAVPTQ